MLSRPVRAVAAVALVCAVLAGCQPPAPTPTPAPSYQCTPEAGGDQFSCSRAQYDDMVAKDKLYAEAEAVYRKFLAEEVRVLGLGGVDEPTSVLLETTSGAFLDGVMRDLRTAKADGVKVDRGSRVVKSMRRMPGVSKGGSSVALAVCVDSTGVHFLRDGKDAGYGDVALDELYFASGDGFLRVIGADGKVVKRC